jgi:hypothetical protein
MAWNIQEMSLWGSERSFKPMPTLAVWGHWIRQTQSLTNSFEMLDMEWSSPTFQLGAGSMPTFDWNVAGSDAFMTTQSL